jgi:FkbH-like protein
MAPAEAIRLVIWDLDETFWQGTLAEGAVTARPEIAALVKALAARGIISSICSKNDFTKAAAELSAQGMWDYFVFPDIGWGPKGPRIAALIEAMQLRPASVLFIDDNPANLAEARYFCPPLQVAGPESLAYILTDPRCAGKADPALTRLHQYRDLAARKTAQAATADATAFLRQSRITVRLDYDIEPHLDRAIELINRTNQLNFTKERLPEDMAAARAALRKDLAAHACRAALIFVRDAYGDYGAAGFYLYFTDVRHRPYLRYFCFSCRLLGLGVETWLYCELGCPDLKIKGDVAANPVTDNRQIDWITHEGGDAARQLAGGTKPLAYVLARGACDMRALLHYCLPLADRMIEELNYFADGFQVLANVLEIATQSAAGFSNEAYDILADFGFTRSALQSVMNNPPPGERGIWLLSLVLDYGKRFRHRDTGVVITLALPAFNLAPGAHPPSAFYGLKELPDHLALFLSAQFDYIGELIPADISAMLRPVLLAAPKDVMIFLIGGSTITLEDDGKICHHPGVAERNAALAAAAEGLNNCEILLPEKFFDDLKNDIVDIYHYHRIVYYRMFCHIQARVL